MSVSFEIDICIIMWNWFQEIFEDWIWEASSCSWELPRSFLFNISSGFSGAPPQQAQPVLPSQPHCRPFSGGTGLVTFKLLKTTYLYMRYIQEKQPLLCNHFHMKANDMYVQLGKQ
jgi:hypothetical protein